MVAETDIEAKFHREVKALMAADPFLQALTLTAGMAGEDSMAHEDMFLWWLRRAWPILKPKLSPIRVNEPCVGVVDVTRLRRLSPAVVESD